VQIYFLLRRIALYSVITDFRSVCNNSSRTENSQTAGPHIRRIVGRTFFAHTLLRRTTVEQLQSLLAYLTVLISVSEKKIDRIEDRLSSIENVLANLASKLSDLDFRKDSAEQSSQSRLSRVGSRVGSGKSQAITTEVTTPAPFEGETAINSQSGYARELLTKVVDSTPSIGQNAEIKRALSALGELVTRQGHATVPTTSTVNSLINRSLSEVDPGKLERPPWITVREMLERALSK
jgi:hypothetical protein